MNDLERLIARANITETKARYCQMLDTKNVGGLRAVFTENATLDASESVSIKNPETGSYDRPLGDAKRQGNSVIAEFIIDSVRGFRTAHQVHTPIIEFLSDDEAQEIGRASCRERVCQYV